MLGYGRFSRRRSLPVPEKKAPVCPSIDLPIPAHFKCPISLDLMKDPVALPTGITYDRQSIEAWLEAGNRTCPVTNQKLSTLDTIPNHALRRMIQQWCVSNRSLGVERIPTPRVPLSRSDASELWEGIEARARTGDLVGISSLVKRMISLGKDSDRNRASIAASSGRCSNALSAAYAAAAAEKWLHAEEMSEILTLLSWTFPLDVDARTQMLSHAALSYTVWLLKNGGLVGRRNAALVVKELASSSDQRAADSLSETEGLMEGLHKVLKEPICQTTTKAALVSVFYLVSLSKVKTSSRFVEMGLVPLLLEMLVEWEAKSVSEKALAALDGIFGCDEGREIAYGHALAVPVLVKKMLRVSTTATEMAVSALSKLCRGCEKALAEAAQVGAFEKVLLVLQLGCAQKTKERATELLKLLNPHRISGECSETMHFMQLKQSF